MNSVEIVIHDREPAVRTNLKRLLKSANPRWDVLEARDASDVLTHVIRDEVTVLVCDDEEILGRARALSKETVGILLEDPDARSIDRVRRVSKPTADVTLLSEVIEAIHESQERRWVKQTLARFLSPDFVS